MDILFSVFMLQPHIFSDPAIVNITQALFLTCHLIDSVKYIFWSKDTC
jgi:hypothetical protein